MLLILGTFIASIIKIAEGSGTVAMITASAMVAAMIPPIKSLG
jgi:H+/gluconate symporter-like permease